MEICEASHGVDFDLENLTHGILNIYGLEIRIARELLNENRRNNIPSNLTDYYFKKSLKKELKYPQVLRTQQIADSGRFSDIELFHALCNMIGKGETGLYTELNQNWEQLEQAIITYMDYLR